MNVPGSTALPSRIRLQADIVAFIAGILAFPMFAIAPGVVGRSNIAILFLVVVLACAAAIASVLTGRAIAHGVYLVRSGARTAVFAALLAAAMMVLAARVFQSQLIALATIFPAAMSILPAAFCGMIFGAIAAGFRLPVAASNDSPTSLRITASEPVIILFIAVCILGFASALIPSLSSPFLSQIAAPLSASSWHYEKPADLNNAPAARWQLATIKPLGRIASDSPLAISTTGDFFACFDGERQQTLKIVDLNTPDRVWTFPINQPVQSIAFSPDARRVAFETDGNPRRIGIVDLKTSQTMFLPKPKGNVIPEGELVWFTAGEIAFQAPANDTVILDLDSLELSDSNASDAWKGLPFAERSRINSLPHVELPTVAHCIFEFRPVIATAEVPTDLRKEEWRMNGGTFLSLKDIDRDYRRCFTIDVRPGDRLLASTDGSKLIRIRQNDAIIAYFVTRPAPALSFNITMPKSPAKYGYVPTELCALVYPPLINPVNQKVIGPDRETVKALLRFTSWNGTNAALYVSEEFLPIQPTDLIADLHVWTRNRAQLVLDYDAKRRWWTSVPPLNETQKDMSKLPTAVGTKPLEHKSDYTVTTESGSLVVKNIIFQPTMPEPSQTPVALSPPATKPFLFATPTPKFAPSPEPAQQATPAPQQPSYPRRVEPNDYAYNAVVSFVTAHHNKANRGDLNALVADYADQVNYFGNGSADRAFIFRTEAKSRGGFRQMSEAIISAIEITELAPQHYRAYYQIAFQAVKKNNQRVSGTSNVYLFLKPGPRGLQIVSQQKQLESGE
jgi:hypothetical protein